MTRPKLPTLLSVIPGAVFLAGLIYGKVWEHMIWLVVQTRKVAAKITKK